MHYVSQKVFTMNNSAIKAFFEPNSIAILGASRDPGKAGYLILKNLLEAGYKGKIFPINPKVQEILGLRSYSSIENISDEIDLCVIVVPSAIVPQILNQCGKKRVKSAVIISGGFRETGKEGEEIEKTLVKIINDTGIRVIGPNCIGVDNPHIGMSMWVGVKKRGSISIISQSGLVGTAIECWAEKENIGISKCISLGNKIDVNEVELLEYFDDDPDTDTIVIYIEGIDQGREFMKTASKVSENKPIVILKGGKTDKGIKAASFHTRALSGKNEILEAAFRQSGIIIAENLEELYDYSKVLSFMPPPKGRGILVITSSGGAGILAVDLIDKLGLKLPQISKKIEERLRKVLPKHCIFDNPFDLTATTSDKFQLVMEENIHDDKIHAFLPIFADPLPQAAEAVKNVVDKTDKPIVVCYVGGAEIEDLEKAKMHSMRIPVFSSPERAVTAINALIKRQELLNNG
jgi:acetyl coenzyme A synthetase (ADP forming)-like protein